jgi:hypothetical protein
MFLEGKDQELLTRLAQAVPLERLGIPDDIAPAPMAVSVSGPAARMTDDLITAAVSALRAAAAQLAHQLA